MNDSVYSLIVESTMMRLPNCYEDTEDFFIGFNDLDNPYLLLPTPKEMFDNDDLFAIRLVPDPLNKFRFELDSNFTRLSFSRFTTFFDDLTYYFGPDENMLEMFLRSASYKTYVEWISNLYFKRIDDLIEKYNSSDIPSMKLSIKAKLSRLLVEA
ncbi:hypothetical protein [Pseudalkalibacillus caeni]|uniref:Uncharacterized protein n=1 Tax=Exobacillus caeni TaxID=2574798 RepID=A0A5R9F6N0_9BACL|nr:hypothetical protein [Pseudalkalibacillus caeni]TLS38159.1 hypothetical protein FCL54_06355 [Pseudalkalibacillus caeni]